MKQVKKQSVVDIAAEQIIEFLGSADIKLGDKLPVEYEMCNMLSISRATLREVYRKLQSQGYLELKNGKGAFVKNKEQDILQRATNWFREHDAQLLSYLEVRLYLDPLAGKLAAQYRTEEDVARLKSIQNMFEDSLAKRDNVKMAQLDAELHKAIVDISKNDLLIALVQIVNYYFEQLRQTSFMVESHADHAIQPHRNIIHAIAKGDFVLAEKESVNHMRIALKDLCGVENPGIHI
ncbi:MAG: FadR/GntR family transcriptional regulator [Sphaerochaetaceae bacterium]